MKCDVVYPLYIFFSIFRTVCSHIPRLLFLTKIDKVEEAVRRIILSVLHAACVIETAVGGGSPIVSLSRAFVTPFSAHPRLCFVPPFRPLVASACRCYRRMPAIAEIVARNQFASIAIYGKVFGNFQLEKIENSSVCH